MNKFLNIFCKDKKNLLININHIRKIETGWQRGADFCIYIYYTLPPDDSESYEIIAFNTEKFRDSAFELILKYLNPFKIL